MEVKAKEKFCSSIMLRKQRVERDDTDRLCVESGTVVLWIKKLKKTLFGYE